VNVSQLRLRSEKFNDDDDDNNNNNKSVQFSLLMCWHKSHKANDKHSIRTYEKYTKNK
jgi:hypothetical protein